MKASLVLSLAAALLFAGCATQTKEQLAAARAAGVSPTLMRKLERWGSLSSEDLIELKRRKVNDSVALRQLDRAGVDFVMDKAEIKKLEAAKVSREVITAAENASLRFVGQYTRPGASFYLYGWGYPYDPFYYELGWPYPRRPLPPPPNPALPGPPGGPHPPRP